MCCVGPVVQFRFFFFFFTETFYMRARQSMVAAACIAAAASRLGQDDCQPLVLALADLVNTQPDQLSLVVHSIESLMSAQLATVQQQQQQLDQQQQQQQQQVQQVPHLKNSSTATSSKQATSTWELDVQPETPTDIQDIHFWHDFSLPSSPPTYILNICFSVFYQCQLPDWFTNWCKWSFTAPNF